MAGVCVCDEIVYIFNKAKCIHKLIQYIINEKDYETFCHHHSKPPITIQSVFPFLHIYYYKTRRFSQNRFLPKLKIKQKKESYRKFTESL